MCLTIRSSICCNVMAGSDVLVFRVYEYAFGRLQICGQRSVDLANNVWLVKEVFPLVRRTPMLHNPFVQELGPVMHQDSTADQNGKIGDVKAALEGPSGQCTHINHLD